MLSQQEQKAWIRLAFSEKIGPITFANLLKYFGSAEKALDNLPVFCMKSGRKRPLTVLPEATYTKAMEALKNLGGNVLFKGQEDYPKSLAVYEYSPIILFTIPDYKILLNVISFFFPIDPCQIFHSPASYF